VPPYHLNARLRRRPDHASLSCWFPLLVRLTWPQRLVVVEYVDDQLRREFGPDLSRYISQTFSAGLIDYLRTPRLTCREQALIYLNSDDPAHMRAARAFLMLEKCLEHQQQP
jgi:hypothetical protein